ncbi:MAG TPA: MerR family transcriptional regulator [Phenylobacterium sp.]
MSGYTVKQVAKLSGVSVRTLHHYDEVGLLKPACVGANGYRYYGREELLRLQQILFHRELGFSLEEIGRVLDAGDFDRVAALKAHRAKLEGDVRRYRRLMRTIDETLAALEGATKMDDKAMWRGFDPERQAKYEEQLVERFGEGVKAEIAAAYARQKDWTQADFDRVQDEWLAIGQAVGAAMRDGVPADSEAVRALMRRLCDWLTIHWGKPPVRESLVGLGNLYETDPDFRSRLEAEVGVGFAEYLSAAMRLFAERELT